MFPTLTNAHFHPVLATLMTCRTQSFALFFVYSSYHLTPALIKWSTTVSVHECGVFLFRTAPVGFTARFSSSAPIQITGTGGASLRSSRIWLRNALWSLPLPTQARVRGSRGFTLGGLLPLADRWDCSFETRVAPSRQVVQVSVEGARAFWALILVKV